MNQFIQSLGVGFQPFFSLSLTWGDDPIWITLGWFNHRHQIPITYPSHQWQEVEVKAENYSPQAAVGARESNSWANYSDQPAEVTWNRNPPQIPLIQL